MRSALQNQLPAALCDGKSRFGSGIELQVIRFKSIAEDNAVLGHQRAYAQRAVDVDGAEHQIGPRGDAGKRFAHGKYELRRIPWQRTILRLRALAACLERTGNSLRAR